MFDTLVPFAEGGWGTHVMHGRSRVTIQQTLASLQGGDGARRVFTDQTGIAGTKREAP